MLSVAQAGPEDVPAITDLLEEVDRFYGVTAFEPVERRRSQVDDAIFCAHPGAFVLLARDDHAAVGLATYSFLWPAADLTRSLYLKELYVAEPYRQHGVGRLLMHRLCGVAVAAGCSRVEFTTDRDNLRAQRFYSELGIAVNTEKIFYRMRGDMLSRMSTASSP